MKTIALFTIRLYQKFISPYKGFSCAYRVHTGHANCSALGYRAIHYFGLWRGIGVLRKRLEKCGVVHRRYHSGNKAFHQQGGFCDIPCDLPCHTPSCDLPIELSVSDLLSSSACEFLLNCLPCDCGGCSFSRKNKQDKDQNVPIPPQKTRNPGDSDG